MTGAIVGKLVLKATLKLAAGIGLLYTSYRIRGGKPIMTLYREAKAERLAKEVADRTKKGIVLDMRDYQVQ